MQYNSLNQLLIEIVMKLTSNTRTNCLINLENTTKQLVKTSVDEKDKKIVSKREENNSKLIRLPFDLINNTALFFDETVLQLILSNYQ